MEEKTRFLTIRITEPQSKVLEAKTAEAGFSKKSDYVRFILFMPSSVLEQIKDIYEKTQKIHQAIEKNNPCVPCRQDKA